MLFCMQKTTQKGKKIMKTLYLQSIKFQKYEKREEKNIKKV